MVKESCQTSIILNNGVKKRAKKYCIDHNLTLSALIESLLKQKLGGDRV